MERHIIRYWGGTCAEWIVERPIRQGMYSCLANYGTVSFDTAIAGMGDRFDCIHAQNKQTIGPDHAPRFVVDMINNDDRVISETVESAPIVTCVWRDNIELGRCITPYP
ncbi:G1 family glutamic endopeptidase [Streptomyces sp. CoH27]|uniref:G1 family glutamic endopeptidase n=1 Tax=Streptomyces sp. CoH27 TaxID=2875763 RepID=UPI0021E616D0|nr:G1 family glutamic endopeptidase [Streptomyces sp. CoH27]